MISHGNDAQHGTFLNGGFFFLSFFKTVLFHFPSYFPKMSKIYLLKYYTVKNTILSLNVDKKTNTAILFTLLYSTKSTLTQIKAELGHSREILSSIYS